jgi:hypothetical protein
LSFLLLFNKVVGQNLPEYEFEILMGETLSFELFSYYFPNDVAPYAQHGDVNQLTPPVNNIYTILYTPDTLFTGTDVFVLETRGGENSGWFSSDLKYSRITVHVLPSIVKAENDNRVVYTGNGEIEADVLLNDYTTHGPLTITELTNIEGGTASISADNTILFEPEPGFTGTAYLNYLAADIVGTTDLGQLSIQVIDSTGVQDITEISLATLNTRPLTILLPSDEFELDGTSLPALGSLSFTQENQVVYKAELDYTVGIDTFTLIDGNQERIYYIEVYDLPNDGQAVVDDVVFTMENEEVVFNVNDNDFKESYMDDWTQPQHGFSNYLGEGEFSYVPDEDFHGYDEFTYTKRVAPLVWQTATVRIGVGNFNPVPLEEYKLNTLRDQAVLVNYNIPVDNYVFEILEQPENGTVTFYEGFQTISIGCDQVSGYNLLVYQPENGYTGTDDFEIDYCPANADCQLVKVSINVLDLTLDPDCPCVGRDCVWEGDTNNDGVVDLKDLLPIGLYMGAEGDSRIYSSSDWIGFNAPDWADGQFETPVNLKHVDTDGNGLIEAIDTLAISENYEGIHTLLPEGVNTFKPYPFYIYTDQDSVNIGDRLFLTISIGNASYPIIDLTGITYSLRFNANVVDSSSVNHTFLTDSWFDNASSTLQMDKQPLDGKIDAGLTRIGGIGISGHGPVAKCDFIVEDDIDGLKIRDAIIPLTLNLTGAMAMDQYGNAFQLPETSKTIYIDLRERKEAPVTSQLMIYPNPAGDYVNIHLNGQNEFSLVKVFSTTGVLIESFNLSEETNNTRLNVQEYNPGVYFIVVQTPRGKTAQRFEVIK